jgi:hypothetical protein
VSPLRALQSEARPPPMPGAGRRSASALPAATARRCSRSTPLAAAAAGGLGASACGSRCADDGRETGAACDARGCVRASGSGSGSGSGGAGGSLRAAAALHAQQAAWLKCRPPLCCMPYGGWTRGAQQWRGSLRSLRGGGWKERLLGRGDSAARGRSILRLRHLHAWALWMGTGSQLCSPWAAGPLSLRALDEYSEDYES